MKLRLTTRISLFFVALAALLLTVLGVHAYRSGSRGLQAAAVSEMLAISVEKSAAVDRWIEEQLANMMRIAASADLAEKALRLTRARAGSEEAGIAEAQLLEELAPHLAGVRPGFLEASIIEPEQGIVIASTMPEEEGRSKAGFDYFERGRADMYLQPPCFSHDLGQPVMTAGAPIRSRDGTLVAVLACRFNLAELQALTSRRTGLHTTEDAYLINAAQFAVTQPRFIDAPAVLSRRIDTEATRLCAGRDSGVALARDYRGVPVIAAYRWNAKHQLGLLVEMDKAEALAPARAFGQSLAVISLLALAGTTVVARHLAKTITRPLRVLHEGIGQFVAGGSLALPVSRDEIGVLAREFNEMAARVSEQTAALAEEVAERRAAQEGLLLRDSALRAAANAIAIVDREGNIEWVNPAFTRLTGYASDELIGQKPRVLKSGHHDAEFYRAMWETILGGSVWQGELVNRRKDGSLYHEEMTITPVRDAAGAIAHFVAIKVDITMRKQADEEKNRLLTEIKAHRERLADLLASVPGVVWEIWGQPDLASHRIDFVSDYVETMVGYSVEEWLATPGFWLQAVHPDDRERAMREAAEIFQKEKAGAAQFRWVRKDGGIIWAELHGIVVRDEAGQPIGMRGVSLDITRRKQMEAEMESAQRELREASRAAGMAEVATTVLHNVGNVLNSVNVSVSLASDWIRHGAVSDLTAVADLLEQHQSDLPGFFAQDRRGIELPGFLATVARHFAHERDLLLREMASLADNVAHIKEIVAMQQSYARVAGVVETVTAESLVEDSLRLNAGALDRHGVRVVREYADLPQFAVDKHRVIQVLVNLIRNAKYALDEGQSAEKRLVLSVRPDGEEHLTIAVSDNGVGIRQENLTRIFEHGFTTRKEGHGFGLHSGAIAAKELGGSLSVHSDGPGRGATFTLRLPLQTTLKT